MTSLLSAVQTESFFNDPYALLLFILLDIFLAAVLVIVAYRPFFKYALDFLCGLFLCVITLPVWLTVAVVSKIYILRTNRFQSVFTARFVAGKNGKPIALHSFTVLDSLDKQPTKFGNFLRKTGIEHLPIIFDLLLLKVSVVGVKPLLLSDEKFVSEEDYARFSVRPGLLNPLLLEESTHECTYEDMFHSDIRYVHQYGFFKDVQIFFMLFIRKIRGEKGDIFGETAKKDYAQALVERGEISLEDTAEAQLQVDAFMEELKSPQEEEEEDWNAYEDYEDDEDE